MLDASDQVYDNILNVAVPQKNSAGIIVCGHIPGLVPPYEEHQARKKAGYTISEWRELDWLDRAIEVAMNRIEGAVEAILQEEAQSN